MSFLRNYLIYNAGNECPDNYHIWSALNMLSCVVSAKVWAERGYFTIYPNIYTTLVGTQGSRKTTAALISRKMLKAAYPKMIVSSNCETKEFMTKFLAHEDRRAYYKYEDKIMDYTPYALFVNELKNFLTRDAVGMINFLTDIYDATGPGNVYESLTKNKGEDRIPSPCLNILACETPEWLIANLKTSIISGGFCRRMNFIYELEAKPAVAFPTITQESLKAKLWCIDWLRSIGDLTGKFEWDDDAKEWFSAWYTKTKAIKHTNVFMEGWYSSKESLAIKLAMIVAVSEGRSLRFTIPYLDMAVKLLDRVEVNLPKLVSFIGRNELSVPTARLLDLITRNGGVMTEVEVRKGTSNDLSPSDYFAVTSYLTGTEQLVKGRVKQGDVERVIFMTKEFAEEFKKKEKIV